MPTIVLKLFASHGTGRTERRTDGWTDRQSSDYMPSPLGSI